jgi:hypothetical protein
VGINHGDFNHDGHEDLAVPDNNGSWGISGSARQRRWIAAGARVVPLIGINPRGPAVGDFNNDGNLDLAVADVQDPSGVSVLIGNGDGTFQAPVYYPAGNWAQDVVAARVNGDSTLDLVVSNYVSNTVSVLLGTGDGTFATHQDFNVGQSPVNVAVADFNQDGRGDIAVTDSGDNATSVLLQEGAPVVVTRAAVVSGRAASLRGSVNPNGAAVSSCEFQWGPTTAYEHAVPCSTTPGPSTSPVNVRARITPLVPGSTFHYRLVPATASGTAHGSDWVLTTPSSGQLTIGNASLGEQQGQFAANLKRVNEYVLPQAGTITSLSTYLQPSPLTGSQPLRGIVYANNSGAPGQRLAITRTLTLESQDTTRWYRMALLAPLALPAGHYWIGIQSGGPIDVPGSGFSYDQVPNSRDLNNNPWPALPSDPFGPITADNEEMSLYATYTPTTPSAPAPPHPTTVAYEIQRSGYGSPTAADTHRLTTTRTRK